MTQLHRQTFVAVALAALGMVSSSAWAASYTIDFKTLFNTATAGDLYDTKTLPFSIAKLTISDLADGSGVQLTLKQNSHVFDSLNGAGNYIDALWIKGPGGALSSVSGAALESGAGYSAASLIKDVGYGYNWNIDFAGSSFAEGQTAVLTLTGSGLTATTFANFAKATPIMLSLGNVGGNYGVAELGNTVHFVGNLPVAVTPVPEPGTYALMGVGLVGIAALRRRRLQ